MRKNLIEEGALKTNWHHSISHIYLHQCFWWIHSSNLIMSNCLSLFIWNDVFVTADSKSPESDGTPLQSPDIDHAPAGGMCMGHKLDDEWSRDSPHSEHSSKSARWGMRSSMTILEFFVTFLVSEMLHVISAGIIALAVVLFMQCRSTSIFSVNFHNELRINWNSFYKRECCDHVMQP